MAAQALTTGQIAVILFENVQETFESQDMMLDKVDFWVPDAADMQNSGNTIWRSVEQHAPDILGWDLDGDETGIIEETYPAVLGTPHNDYVQMRADKLRDRQFWERRGKASGRKQASVLNSMITQAMINQGSMFYRANPTSGYDFISEAQTLMNERQLPKGMRNFLFNDRDNNFFSKDLAGRQTLQGKPDTTWRTGQIGNDVAEFDLFTGSFLPNLVGGTTTGAAVTATLSFAPEGGTVDPTTDEVTNVDYRRATIPVDDSTGLNVGDKITFTNSSVPVMALGLDDKVNTGIPMTFTIVNVVSGTSIQIFPKPIALDDSNLSALEQAYANVDTQILNTAVVVRQNVTASAKTNLFWDQDAVEVMGGTIPIELFKQFAGMKTISTRMKNGQFLYMVYDGNITDMTFKFRIFTWYGVTIRNPSAVGVAERYAPA